MVAFVVALVVALVWMALDANSIPTNRYPFSELTTTKLIEFWVDDVLLIAIVGTDCSVRLPETETEAIENCAEAFAPTTEIRA